MAFLLAASLGLFYKVSNAKSSERPRRVGSPLKTDPHPAFGHPPHERESELFQI